MKKILLLIMILGCSLNISSQTLKEKLISTGAWFLFSTKIEQEIEGDLFVEVSFFKKDDVSSLFFDSNNHLYSVFSDQPNEMNDDLWKLVNDETFVILSLDGQTSQIMEILECSSSKLVIRYCNETDDKGNTCILSTYFSTKLGWLSDAEIDELNAVGILEIEI